MSLPLLSVAVLLLTPEPLLAAMRVSAKTDCPNGDCRSLKSSSCWSARDAASALLRRQCQLADCDTKLHFSDSTTGGPTATLALLHRLFAYVDTNNDGLATLTELLTALASLPTTPRNGAPAERRPNCIDMPALTVEESWSGSGDSGVGKKRFAALLGIHLIKFNGKDGAAEDALTSLLDEASEVQLKAPVNRDFRMRCPLSTIGKAERIQWRRHGNRLTRFSTKRGRSFNSINWHLSRFADTLVLKSVTKAAAGIYDCCSSVWRRLCVTVALNAIPRPRVRVHPPMQTRQVGERAALYCRVDAGCGSSAFVAEPCKIRWLFNSKPVDNRRSSIVTTDTGSSLSIAPLGKHHTGLYTCSVTNQAGLAESAGSVYVRDATETDYSNYPLSPKIWSTVGPTPTKAVVFHSDGYAILDFTDCALKSPVSARLCGCHSGSSNDEQLLQLQLLECDWGDDGYYSGSFLTSAGRRLYAAQPKQRRLLMIEPASSSARAWFSPTPLSLGCQPALVSYRRSSDTLWTACNDGQVLQLPRASASTPNDVAVRRLAVWRLGSIGDRVLRLPDSSSNVLVTLQESSASVDGYALMIAVAVPDLFDFGIDGGVGKELARLLVPDSIDRADVIPQGDTLLLHSVRNSSTTTLIAVDLTTGQRIPFFSRFFSSNPTGRLVLSKSVDRVLHLTGDTMYLYRVLPSGQLALSLHSSLDVKPLDPQFQTGPDGTERLLAVAELPDGGMMTASPGEATTRLTFDPHLRGLSRLSAPEFGTLALAYSSDAAIFVNMSSGVPITAAAAGSCRRTLFLGLQAVHWIWPY